MYKHLMVPVDLEHTPEQDKALQTAADLARHYQATLCLVAVSASLPNAISTTPERFAVALNLFAREHGERFGVTMDTLILDSTDPAVDLADKLLEDIQESETDLVVMASHKPDVSDRLHLTGSHAAQLVRQSDVSVFVVR